MLFEGNIMDWNMNKQFQEQNASKCKYMQAFSESLTGVHFGGWTKKGLTLIVFTNPLST